MFLPVVREGDPVSAHTPGPWEAVIGDDVWITGPDRDQPWVCDIVPRDHNKPPNEEDLANARLIGAAPDLLAALKAAREFGLDDFTYGDQAMYAQMDAAIAKAEGR